MGLAIITPEARAHYGLSDSVNGVLIVLVSKDTEASQRGLKPGDVIMNVDGTPVTTPTEVQGLIEKAVAAQRRYLGLLIASKGESNWVSFFTGKQPE
jgi:serine protease Do